MDNNLELTVLPHVRWIVNNDGAVLLDTNSGSMFGVNGTGGLMWKCLTERHSPEEIIQCVTKEYGADREQVAKDFELFVAELKSKGLVDRASANAI